jgi:hypothetical protein
VQAIRELDKNKVGWIPTPCPDRGLSVCAKSSLRARKLSTSAEAIALLREKFIRNFGAETAVIANESHGQRLAYTQGTIGAAMYALNPIPGRVKLSVSDSDEALSLRSGCWECLELWCNIFPHHLELFVKDLCEMGQAIGAVEEELEDTCVVIRNLESRNWLSCYCGDGHPAPAHWQAPAWLVGWPAELENDAITSARLKGRLDSDQTNEVCNAIQNAVGKNLALASVEALNDARILIAKQESRSQARYKDRESGGTSEPRNNHPSKFHERIVSLMKKHPTKSHREILGAIDAEEGLDIPNRFKRHEHRSRGMVMVGAYDCSECRRSVEVFMSRMRGPLGLPQAPKSRRF